MNLVNDCLCFPLILEKLHSIPRLNIEYAFISEEYSHPSANEVDQKMSKNSHITVLQYKSNSVK